MKNNSYVQPLVIGSILIALMYVLQHFFKDLVWGCIVAVLAYPLFSVIITRVKNVSLSSFLALFMFGLVAFLPAVFTLNILSGEVKDLMQALNVINKTGVPPPDIITKLPQAVAQPIIEWWNSTIALPGGLFKVFKGFALTQNTAVALKQFSTYVASDLLHFVISSICAWVLLSNHKRVVEKINNLLNKIVPSYSTVFKEKTPKMLKATAFGLGSVALLEGVVLGIAYWLAGAPFPLLLAIMTAYMALIPGGAPLSFTLVSLIVLGQGNSLNAVLLFSWGAFELFMVDKFIRPKLIGHEVGLPFLAVLLSLLGGVSTLGVIGLFVGPVLMTVAYSILDFDEKQN